VLTEVRCEYAVSTGLTMVEPYPSQAATAGPCSPPARPGVCYTLMRLHEAIGDQNRLLFLK
jgi:hypothetical protein